MLKSFLRKREVLVISAILVVSVAALLLMHQKKESTVAIVTYYNQVIQVIDLDDDGFYSIQGDLPVTLEVRDHRIRFVDSRCPDHICEGYGWLGGEIDNDIAICMPAGITVRVERR